MDKLNILLLSKSFNFEKIKYIFVFFIAIFLLLSRNIDSLLSPIMYTEDAEWLGMAFTD